MMVYYIPLSVMPPLEKLARGCYWTASAERMPIRYLSRKSLRWTISFSGRGAAEAEGRLEDWLEARGIF